jgi:hypothetical protein
MSGQPGRARQRPPTFRVVLRRANGRFVRAYPAWSRYGAKQIRDWLDDRYDVGYYAEVEKT